MSIYVCSDIHGQYGLYKKMLDESAFSDKDQLYILGDMIDRGPDSMELVLDVMGRKNVVSMIGNHELLMLDHVYRNKKRDYWFHGSNGGKKTVRQFHDLPADKQEAILQYLKDMPIQIELVVSGKKFLLSHSSFLDHEGTAYVRDHDWEEVFNIVWRSPWRCFELRRIGDYKQDGRIHVIGHVPVQVVWKVLREDPGVPMPAALVDEENHIVNIDLGCASLPKLKLPGACLCCMDLEAYAEGKENAFRYVMPEE